MILSLPNLLHSNLKAPFTIFSIQSDWGSTLDEMIEYLKDNPVDQRVADLKHVGPARLWKLYTNGYMTVSDLTVADVVELADVMDVDLEKATAVKALTPAG